MIFILVLLAIGAVLGIAGFFGVIGLLNWNDARISRKNYAMRAERAAHEASVMKITQDAVQQMLGIARSIRR